MSDLAEYADPSCRHCYGSGVDAADGAVCPCDCVANCAACGEPIEWDHIDDAPTHHPDCSREARA